MKTNEEDTTARIPDAFTPQVLSPRKPDASISLENSQNYMMGGLASSLFILEETKDLSPRKIKHDPMSATKVHPEHMMKVQVPGP